MIPLVLDGCLLKTNITFHLFDEIILVLLSFLHYRVGKFISTKLPRSKIGRRPPSTQWKPCTELDWEDITSEYKFEEGKILE